MSIATIETAPDVNAAFQPDTAEIVTYLCDALAADPATADVQFAARDSLTVSFPAGATYTVTVRPA